MGSGPIQQLQKYGLQKLVIVFLRTVYIYIYKCKNNKFIFYNIVHDQIYHDLMMRNQVAAKQTAHLTTTRLAVQLQNWNVPF